jgi:hypothetical protein
MLIDCDTCTVRGVACGGCVVTALFEAPPEVAHLGAAELHAIEVLARAGLEATVLEWEVTPSRSRSSHGSRRRARWEGAA